MNSFANLLPQLRLPVLGSPMFIASGPDLVKAQCQAGIIGAFPTLNARPASRLTDWLDESREPNAAFTAANPDRP
ncbi:MAG: nitronate monooxygenase, partial [Brevibacterium sp.]|nr:nitronate monooxygenase [Brevibacterium sp.]